MNKKTHTILLITFFWFLTTSSLFFYFLYEINNQGIRLTESKKLIGEHSTKEASFNTVQNLLEQTKEDRQKIKDLFIEEKGVISFISNIENTASRLGVKLTTSELSIIPSKLDAAGVVQPGVLVVGFSFSGSEIIAWNFLNLLENIPYHKTISQLSFNKTENSIWSANVIMHLTLRYE